LAVGPAQHIQAKGILTAIQVYRLEGASPAKTKNSDTSAKNPEAIG
jgi:hypothetical protein